MFIHRLRALGGAGGLGAQRAQNRITIFALRTLSTVCGYADYAFLGVGRIGHRLVLPIGQAVVGAVRDFFQGDIIEQAPINPLQAAPLTLEQAQIDPLQAAPLTLEQACLDPDSFAKASAILDPMSEADRAKCRPLLAQLMAKCSGNLGHQMVVLEEIEVNPAQEQVGMICALGHLLDTNLPIQELYNALIQMRQIEVDHRDSLLRNVRILMSEAFNDVALLIVYLNQQNKPSDAVVKQLKQLCDFYGNKHQPAILIYKVCHLPSNGMREAILAIINSLDFKRISFGAIQSIIDELSKCELDKIRSWESMAALNTIPLQDQTVYTNLFFGLLTKILNDDEQKFFLKTALLPLPECLQAIKIQAPRALPLAQLFSSSLDALICALLTSKSNIEDDQIQCSFEFFSHVSTPFDALTAAFYFERGLKQVPRERTVQFAQECSKLAIRFSHPNQPLPSHLSIAIDTLITISPEEIELVIGAIVSMQQKASPRDFQQLGQEDLNTLIPGMIVGMTQQGESPLLVLHQLGELVNAGAPMDGSVMFLNKTSSQDRSKWLPDLIKLLTMLSNQTQKAALCDEVSNLEPHLYEDFINNLLVISQWINLNDETTFKAVTQIHPLSILMRLIFGRFLSIDGGQIVPLLQLLSKLDFQVQEALSADDHLSLQRVNDAFIIHLTQCSERGTAIQFSLDVLNLTNSLRLDAEHPLLIQAIVTFRSANNTRDNPYLIFNHHKSRTPIAFKPEGMFIEGRKVALSFEKFAEISQLYSFAPSELPPVGPKEWSELGSRLNSSETAKAILAHISNDPWSAIESTLSSPFLSDILAANTNPMPPVSAQFRAILHYLLSVNEEQCLQVLCGIQACHAGKSEGIAMTYHTVLPEGFKLKKQLAQDAPEGADAQHFFASFSQKVLLELLSGNNPLMQELTGQVRIGQLSHQSLFIKNLIARSIGLQHETTFDLYTALVCDKLKQMTLEEALEIFARHATALHLASQLQHAYKKGDVTYPTLAAICGEPIVWTMNDEDLENIKFELTLAGAVEILLRVGLLA